MRVPLIIVMAVVLCSVADQASAANIFRLVEGNPNIQQAGILAFGPQGVLFVGDAKSAAVFAIGTGDSDRAAANVEINVDHLEQKLATAVGAGPGEVLVNDLAVNPLSGNVYVSITKQDGKPGLVKVDTSGGIGEIELDQVWFSKAELSDAPEDKVVGQGRRRRNLRNEAITDLAFVDGNVIVSGLSNRESASGVRSIPFPFADTAEEASLEIYHAAHGRSEDYAAIRTFVPFVIDGKPNLLAGFTCTPLVRFPLSDISTASDKIRGTTVAELGNRNRPLDMFVYQQGDKYYLLLSNSARGVMKIDTEAIEETEGLDEPVRGGGTAGLSYETIDEFQNVVQMDRAGEQHAVLLVSGDEGALHLRTVPLP